MSLLIAVVEMLVVAVLVALLVARFSPRAADEALERDERDISHGPSGWWSRDSW
jgi:hypothetical protein